MGDCKGLGEQMGFSRSLLSPRGWGGCNSPQSGVGMEKGPEGISGGKSTEGFMGEEEDFVGEPGKVSEGGG